MTDETEQKIMDAALAVFAKNGYKSSTTKNIAEKSGFTEMTLFRKFKTKKNLYDRVLTQNVEIMIEDYKKSLFTSEEFPDVREFLDFFIKKSVQVSMDNFEIFYLSVNEENKLIEPMMADTLNFTGEYLKKKIKNPKIDFKTLGLTINSFVYVVNLERYHGRIASFGKPVEEVIEDFIELIYCMVKT
jgi:TetR/AcrR family transcriptional regulator